MIYTDCRTITRPLIFIFNLPFFHFKTGFKVLLEVFGLKSYTCFYIGKRTIYSQIKFFAKMWCSCMINNESIIPKRLLNCKKVNTDNISSCILIFGRGGVKTYYDLQYGCTSSFDFTKYILLTFLYRKSMIIDPFP